MYLTNRYNIIKRKRRRMSCLDQSNAQSSFSSELLFCNSSNSKMTLTIQTMALQDQLAKIQDTVNQLIKITYFSTKYLILFQILNINKTNFLNQVKFPQKSLIFRTQFKKLSPKPLKKFFHKNTGRDTSATCNTNMMLG